MELKFYFPAALQRRTVNAWEIAPKAPYSILEQRRHATREASLRPGAGRPLGPRLLVACLLGPYLLAIGLSHRPGDRGNGQVDGDCDMDRPADPHGWEQDEAGREAAREAPESVQAVENADVLARASPPTQVVCDEGG